MSDFGMFTNEGDIALAEKLNEALDSMPSGLTAHEQYARFSELCEADADFCEKHGEWSDTAVREIVYSLLEAPTKLIVTDAPAMVLFEGNIQINVPTLDGDGQKALERQHDEIVDILRDALEIALNKIEKQLGVNISEWSGIETRIV